MQSLAILSNFFQNSTLIHSFDNEYIHSEALKNTPLKVHELVTNGVIAGVSGYVGKVLFRSILLIVEKAVTTLKSQSQSTKKEVEQNKDDSEQLTPKEVFSVVVLSPFIEEVIFRLILQRGTKRIQDFIKNRLPSDHESISHELCSMRSRIVANHIFFSLVHTTNTHNSTIHKIVDISEKLLIPTDSFVFETHNQSFIASLSAHMAHNFCVVVHSALIQVWSTPKNN